MTSNDNEIKGDNGRQTDAPQVAPPAASPPPPRGPSTAMVVAVVVTFTLALVIGVALSAPLRRGSKKLWNATVGRIDKDHAHATARQAYTCGMHPWVIKWEPGDCPICQMELTPIDPAKFTGKVEIDPVIVQNMGVRVEPVRTGPLVKKVRTVGTVEYAEPLVRDVNTKIEGWIERLHVNSVGAHVNAGDVLFELYSPDLYAAQEEYLLAFRSQGKVQADFLPDAAQSNAQLLESARTRLLYFDITAEQIAQLERDGKPAKTMTIRSPFSGIVTEKEAIEGMKVEAGMRIYRVADLSTVWVMGTVYEYQLPYLQQGQRATMTLPYLPGRTFEGTVVYVYPYLSEESREVKVRLEFDNPDGLLKPGMFANVELNNTLAESRTLAPRSAIIDTGKRQVAFVSQGQGKFEPRNVQVGVETEDGQVEILSGLQPGEMVVTSGQFLIDSEARIRESLAKMIQGEMAADQAPTTAPAEPKAVEFVVAADGSLEQKTCVVSGLPLGSMGDPYEHVHDGVKIKFCCADCVTKFSANPQPFLDAIERAKKSTAGAGRAPGDSSGRDPHEGHR